MRKTMGFLLMGIIVGGFILSMSSRFNDKDGSMGDNQKVEINNDKKILSVEEEIQNAYPSKPDAVVELHNELMKAFYGAAIGEKGITDYVRVIRQLYSREFLAVNTAQQQEEDLRRERENIDSLKLNLVTSEIKDIYIFVDEEGHESKAEVHVIHTTNEGSIDRTYYLIQEDGVWKIRTWENQEENAGVK